MDSALALHWAVEHSASQVHAWGVDYKQRHSRELESAKAIAKAAWVPFKLLTARIPWAPISSDVIPGRNLMLLSMVASQAATRHSAEAVTLVVGANHADLDGFPDCRPGFLSVAAKAISLGLDAEVSIVAPFMDKTKADLVRYARAEPARWHALSLSWSCYEGLAKPCGVCGACVKRAAGFAEAGEVDPCL